MNDNRSFLVTLLLAVGSGVVIGLFVFGLSGRSAQPAPAPAAIGNQASATAPSAPSPSTSAEPMAPVHYDDAGATGDATPSPAQTAEAPRKVLM